MSTAVVSSDYRVGAEDIVRALLNDARFTLKVRGGYLRGGPCPSCGKNELFTSVEKPWILKCSRLNKCGWEETTRELLPELFENIAEKYTPTQQEPNRTADAYLGLNRGFDISKLRGMYEQGMFQYPNSSHITPTVRVYMNELRTVWWERLINPLSGRRKANFKGDYKGTAWTPPEMKLERGDRCFLVEGFFHNLALLHTGRKAATCWSCNNFPEKFIEQHKGKNIRWTIALDADPAGRKAAKKFAKLIEKAGERCEVLLLPSSGKDWDDYHRTGSITGAFIKNGLYYGRLFMAATANEKAYHHYLRHELRYYIIDFDNCMYRIECGEKFQEALETAAAVRRNKEEQQATDETEQAAEETQKDTQNEEMDWRRVILESPKGWDIFLQHADVTNISNVFPEMLYHEADELIEKEQYYVMRINFPRKAPVIIQLEGSYLSSAQNFAAALLSKTAGGDFSGTNGDFLHLRKRWLNIAQDKSNTTVKYLGYVPSVNAYLFDDAAFYKGKQISLNNEGYYQIGDKGIRPILKGLNITTDGVFDPSWLENYVKAFHWQGLALLAFWLGSLFAQQIREEQKSFPFFELTGEPGAGKSTILEFLWKCIGRNGYEGFDILKATAAGQRRAFSQLSNLPIVLIESDRDNGSKDGRVKMFDMDHCKPFYNGRGTGTRGVNNGGNEVYDTIFQGTLVISQNAEVGGSEALLERIVHCHASKDHHSVGTRDLARWFERQTAENVGGFLRCALRAEKKILETYFAAFKHYEEQFGNELENLRILKNHAQIAACGAALSVLFPQMTKQRVDKLANYLLQRAIARECRVGQDHPIVKEFWEVYYYLNEESDTRKEGYLNHSSDPNVIAISITQFISVAKDHGFIFQRKALIENLPSSQQHVLLARSVAKTSRWTKKTIRRWEFSM